MKMAHFQMIKMRIYLLKMAISQFATLNKQRLIESKTCGVFWISVAVRPTGRSQNVAKIEDIINSQMVFPFTVNL